MTEEPKKYRFLTIEQAAEELNVSHSQIPALLKTGELRAIQVGGRGLWRIGRRDIEDYVSEAYRRTAERIAAGISKTTGIRTANNRFSPSSTGQPSSAHCPVHRRISRKGQHRVRARIRTLADVK